MAYKYFMHFILGILGFTLFFTESAYAQISPNAVYNNPVYNDPYENFNRHIYAFNKSIDKILIKPVAKVYQTVIPPLLRTGVTHFFNNLDMIPTVINDGLQGNSYNFGRDTWRFVINSTIGIGGLFDPAKNLHLPAHHEDFGLTLSKWGYKNSNYLVLPLLGPSTVRDTAALPVNYVSAVYPYIDDTSSYALYGLNVINGRANLLNYDNALDQTFDAYAAIRNGYLQKRQALAQDSAEDGN